MNDSANPVCTMWGKGSRLARRQQMREIIPRNLVVWTFFLLAFAARGQQGPPTPPKPDLPYIIHATNLVETESSRAIEQTKKNEQWYFVEGMSSGVKTPMARPEFVLKAENLDPDSLELYRFEPKNGKREILIRKKKKVLARPYFLSLETVEPGVFRIRVDDVLDNGEYCLTPNGSDSVFCFTVH